MDFNKLLLKNKLIEATKNFRNPKKAREYYWDCIVKHGYSVNVINQINPDFVDFPYFPDSNDSFPDFNEYSNDSYPDYYKCSLCGTELNPGDICGMCKGYLPSTSENLSKNQSYTQNKTFIEYLKGDSSKRMINLNTWINNNSSDSAFIKAVEIISNAISEMNIPYEDQVLKVAINTYFLIKEYYTTNEFNLKNNSGSLRRGYIVWCIYYSLLGVNIVKDLSEITPYVSGATLADLPAAAKNIQIIFKNNILNQNNQNQIETICNIKIENVNEFNIFLNTLITKGLIKKNPSEAEKAGAYYFLHRNSMKINDFTCKNTSVASIRKVFLKILNNIIF